MNRLWNRAAIFGVFAFSAVAFFGGINWGLPSRESDRFLFGGQPPWSGVEIEQYLPREGLGDAGADVAATRLDRSKAIVLNATDADRLRIVRRYRLFTYQPDEWVTIAALSKMHPASHDFDPKLYQYGGVWVYTVGAIYETASVLGLAVVSPDITEYLDRPDEIGRLYVIARSLSAVCGMIGAWLAYDLIKRCSGSHGIGLVGALCFAAMPAVLDLAHEAKPHLACLAATMAAAACGARYLESSRRRWWMATGVFCGVAWGLVLSGVVALAILPAMAILKCLRSRREETPSNWYLAELGAAAIACGVFIITNPYLVKHLIFPGAGANPLPSNMDNTAAMYSVAQPLAGLWNVVKLTGEGTSLLVASLGVVGSLVLLKGRLKGACNDGVWLLAGPAVLTGVVFSLVGAGKPGEFGRFLLDIDVLLLMLAIAAAARWVKGMALRAAILALLAIAAILSGGRYWLGFWQDTLAHTTRTRASEIVTRLEIAGNRQVDLWAEPAPYSAPPMDLFGQNIVLSPRDWPMGTLPDEVVGVAAVDRIEPGLVPDGFARVELTGWGQSSVQTPISWAAKPFLVWVPLDRVRAATVPTSRAATSSHPEPLP